MPQKIHPDAGVLAPLEAIVLPGSLNHLDRVTGWHGGGQQSVLGQFGHNEDHDATLGLIDLW